MDSFVFVMDVVGTVAFAISGAMVAIRKKMDIFGVCILALTTATGGGLIRDLIIGKNPPQMFRDPFYVLVSVLTAIVVFSFFFFERKDSGKKSKYAAFNEKILFLCDSLGLAAFTVDGVNAGMVSAGYKSLFLVVFLGTLTGVGGGLLRDVFAQEMPVIFVKQVYACACILGGFLAGILWNRIGANGAMLAGFVVTLAVRFLAAYFRWDLPKISGIEENRK